MSEAQQLWLVEELLKILQEDAHRPQQNRLPLSAHSKLTESLATVAMTLPKTFEMLLTMLMRGVDDEAGSNGHPSLNHPTCKLFVQILSAMCEELSESEEDYYAESASPDDDMQAIRSIFEQHGAEIRRIFQTVLPEIVEIRLRGSYVPPDQLVIGAPTNYPPFVREVTGHAITILSCPQIGVSVDVLQEHGLWPHLCQLFRSFVLFPNPADVGDHADFLPASLSILFSLFLQERGLPNRRTAAREHACEIMRRMLLSTQEEYMKIESAASIARSSGDIGKAEALENMIDSIATVASFFAEREMGWLCMDRSNESNHDPQTNESRLLFFDYLCHITRHPYLRDLAEPCWAAWAAMGTITKNQPLRPEYWTVAINALIHSFTYPRLFDCWLPSGEMLNSNSQLSDPNSIYFEMEYLEDHDNWSRHRDKMADALRSAIDMVGCTQFIDILLSRILMPTAESTTWQQYEGVLTILSVVSDEIQLFFEDDQPDTRPSEEAKSHVFQRIQQLLVNIFQWIGIGGQTDASHTPKLHTLLIGSCCALIESFTYLPLHLPPQQSTSFIHQSVEFLIKSIPLTQSNPSHHPSSNPSHLRPGQWLHEEGYLAPMDGRDFAGLAFCAMCKEKQRIRGELLNSPPLMSHTMNMILHQQGFSEHITPSMRRLWLTGFASLLSYVAFNDTVDNILTPGSPTLQRGEVMLQQLLSHPLQLLSQIFTKIQLWYQHGPLSKATKERIGELDLLANALVEQLQILYAVIRQIAFLPNETDSQQKLEGVHKKLSDVELSTNGSLPPIAPSLGARIFPTIQQIANAVYKYFRRKDTRTEPLTVMISIQSAVIAMMYTNELVPLHSVNASPILQPSAPSSNDFATADGSNPSNKMPLETLLDQSLQVYLYHPLPAVLRLFDRAVQKNGLGSRISLRSMWMSVIGQVFNHTLNHRTVRRAIMTRRK